jgi:cell division protease FtsH
MRFLLFLGILGFSHTIISQKHSRNTQLSASVTLFLQQDYKTAYRQLDEIAGTLQYFGQIINKGSLKLANKNLVQRWILEHLQIIKGLKRSDENSNEKALLNLVKTSKSLIIHLTNTATTVFADPYLFQAPILIDRSLPEPLTDEARVEMLKEIEENLDENERLIDQFYAQANSAGLTERNKWARKIDAFNDRWKITQTLEKLPKYLGFAGLALFLMPKNWVDKSHIPGLGKLKEWVGSSKYIDEEGHYTLKGLPVPQHVQPEPRKTLGGFFEKNNEDYHTLKGLGATAVTLFFADEHIGSVFSPLKQKFRTWWNLQKGYDIPARSTYRSTGMTLDDPKLILREGQVEELKKIARYIAEPESFDRSASGLERGILLTGPSRNGKTLAAMALCGTLNELMVLKDTTKKFTFRALKGGEIKWNHDGIKGIIQEAKDNAPCVLFIDELHNLPLQTKEGGETLTEFLTMAEELHSTNIGDAVILLAATNQAELLDGALLKPGRFGKRIHFEAPSRDTRNYFFNVMCQQNSIDPTDFDIEALARQTADCSFGDLDLIFKNARFAARERQGAVQQEDFQQNIYQHVYRLRNDKQLPLSQAEKKLIAAHLAGHTLMHLLHENEIQETLELTTLKGKWPKIVEARYFDTSKEALDARRVLPKSKFGHVITSKKAETISIPTHPVLAAKIKLAGAIAEIVLLGSTNYSYHEKDKSKALGYLEKLEFNGLPKESYTTAELAEPMKRAKERLAQCEKEVTEILTAHKSDLQKIANALEEKELLTKRELKELLENPHN